MPIGGHGSLHEVQVLLSTRCLAIDRLRKHVITNNGELSYDKLIIATGARPRPSPDFMEGVPTFSLRTDADARALRSRLSACNQIAVLGAGLIGLEVAASAAELGIKVHVIESSMRVMGRSCDEVTSLRIMSEHRRRGVEFHLGSELRRSTILPGGKLALNTAAGDQIDADLIVSGIGVEPNDYLAEEAGLEVDDGIIVDQKCRTSDEHIFAAGDVTRIRSSSGTIRFENWRHAQDQGAIAGRNAAGSNEDYVPFLSYWSEQYDMYIQGIGDIGHEARVERPMTGNSSLAIFGREGSVVGAVGINAQKDVSALRRIIERKITLSATDLMDPTKPFAALMKQSVSQGA
jgi:NADPH-dependent 2,4-dienoyl-CoA reductase/sulfur reductase-like enzyme